MCNSHELTARNPRRRIPRRHHRTDDGLEMLDGSKRSIGVRVEGGDTAIGGIDTLVQTIEDVPRFVQRQPRRTGTTVGGLGDDRQVAGAIIGSRQRQGGDVSGVRCSVQA